MILLLFWRKIAATSFLPSVSSIAACIAEQQSHACFRFKSISEWSADQIVLHKRAFWSVLPSTQRNGSFKTTTDNRNKTRWTSTFTNFNHHESWAAALTSVIAISLTLHWRLTRTSRKTVGLCHYHYHYHYHLCTNPLYCVSHCGDLQDCTTNRVTNYHCTILSESLQWW